MPKSRKKKTGHVAKLLLCNCGECSKWRIGRDKKGHFIECVSCGDVDRVEFKADPQEKVYYKTVRRP